MNMKLTFKHLPAAAKSIRFIRGEPRYMCNGYRLPKFIWEKL